MVRIKVIKGPIDPRIKEHGEVYFNTFMPSYCIKLPNGMVVTSEDSFVDDTDIELPYKREERKETPITE